MKGIENLMVWQLQYLSDCGIIDEYFDFGVVPRYVVDKFFDGVALAVILEMTEAWEDLENKGVVSHEIFRRTD
jgi:hypothetical protein